MGLFSDPGERAKAMGVFGFVMSGGGAVGVLLGGVLTGLLTWHWIFLVNVPIGDRRLDPGHPAAARRRRPDEQPGRLDVAGAGLVTVALMLAVYGVVGGNEAGWTSARTLGILGVAVALLVAFVVREARIEHPLMPLRLFRLRNVAVSQVVGVLWAGAMFACFFLTALYMQGVLGYDALEVGLAYLPSCVVMALMSLRVSDKLVMRFGIRPPLTVGLGLAAASLALFSQAPVDGSYVVHVLPGMVLLGIGAGIAFNPVLLAAMGDVEPHEAGLASGVVNTSFMMGGALGLAVLVSLSTWRTGDAGRVGLRTAGGAERRLPAGLRRRCRDGRRRGGHRRRAATAPADAGAGAETRSSPPRPDHLSPATRPGPARRPRAGLPCRCDDVLGGASQLGRRCREGAAGPPARPVAVGRSAADRQDRAGRWPGVVGGHRRVPPRAAVPGALVGGAGRARHALPDVLARRPAGGGHLRRGLPRLGRRGWCSVSTRWRWA